MLHDVVMDKSRSGIPDTARAKNPDLTMPALSCNFPRQNQHVCAPR